MTDKKQQERDFMVHVALIADQDRITFREARLRAWLEGESGLEERRKRRDET